MKTLTKLLAVVAVLVFSITVFAHMRGDGNWFAFHHPMMGVYNSQYQDQATQELKGVENRIQNWGPMRSNPEFMLERMRQVHDRNFRAGRGAFGCHYYGLSDEKSPAQE